MSDQDLRELEEAAADNDAATPDQAEQEEAGALPEQGDQVGKGYTGAASTDENKKGWSKGKTTAVVGSVGGTLFISIAFLMFMTLFRGEHIRNLLWDYRFARFHGQIARRIKANAMVADGVSTSTPDKVTKFKKTVLGKKLERWSPEKAFNELGNAGMDVQVEKQGIVGFREQRITGFTDPVTGERVVYERASNIPGNATVVDSKVFADRLSASAGEALQEAGHTRYFQKQTRSLLESKVKIRFGDRFKAYKEKLKSIAGDNTPTPDEEAQALREADIDAARGGGSVIDPPDSLKEAEEAATEDLADGTPQIAEEELSKPPTDPDARPPTKTAEKLSGASSTYAKVSSAVMLVTFGCIAHDLSNRLDDVMTMRIEAPMRMTANVMGEAEQLKNGQNVETAAVRERSKDFNGFEDSAAARRINGQDPADIPESSELSVTDLPFKFWGTDLHTIAEYNNVADGLLKTLFTGGLSNLPGLGAPADRFVSHGCQYVLNPKVQAGIAAADLVALVGSFGTSETAGQAIIKGIDAGVKIGAGVGIGKVVFEFLVPKLLTDLAGGSGVLLPNDPQNGNKLDVGATLLARQSTQMAGGSPITDSQAQKDNEEAFAQAKRQHYEQDGAWAYIDPSSPYSLSGQIALQFSGSPGDIPGQLLAKTASLASSIFSLNRMMSLFSHKTYAAVDGFTTYGIQQYGIPSDMEDVDPIDNALAVDGNGQLQALLDKYHQCFDTSIANQELSGLFGDTSGVDYSVCNEPQAKQLGLYMIDNCAIRFMSTDVTANNCSILPGSGDLSGD